MLLTVNYTAPLPSGFQSGSITLTYQRTYIDKDGRVSQPIYRALINPDKGLPSVQTGVQLQIVGMGQGDPIGAGLIDAKVSMVVTGFPTPQQSTFQVIPLDTGGGTLNLHLPAVQVPTVGPLEPTLAQLIVLTQAALEAINSAQDVASVTLSLIPPAVNRADDAADAALRAAALTNIVPVANDAARLNFFATTSGNASCRQQDTLHIWTRYNGVIEDVGTWSLSTLNYLKELNRLMQEATTLRPVETIYRPRMVRRPIITVIADDGYIQDFTVLKPLFDSKGVKASFATTLSFINSGANFMTTTQLLQLQSEGHSVMSHSLTHKDQTTYPVTPEGTAALVNDLTSSRTQLRAMGFSPVDHYVYPFTSTNLLVAEKARGAGYLTAVGIGAIVQVPPLNSYAINRMPVTSATTLADLTAWADAVKAANGWGVMLIHSGYDFPPAVQGYFAQFIDYAKGLGIAFENYDVGYGVFGNQLDAGDFRGGYGTVIDRDGVFSAPQSGGLWVKDQDTYTAAMGRLAFPDKRVVRFGVSASVGGWPGAGTVEVDRTIGLTYGYNAWNRQTWWAYQTNTALQRRAITDTTWTNWEKVSNDSPPVISAAFNSLTGNSPASAFTNYAITIVPFNSSGAQGYPSDFYAGQMTVDLTGGLGWAFRTLKKYQSPDTYISSIQGDGTWGPWIKTGPNNVQPSLELVANGSAGTVGAYGTVTIQFNLPGVNQGDVVIASRANRLFFGLMQGQVGCYANGVVSVSIHNLTNAAITDDNQQWHIQVVRS